MQNYHSLSGGRCFARPSPKVVRSNLASVGGRIEPSSFALAVKQQQRPDLQRKTSAALGQKFAKLELADVKRAKISPPSYEICHSLALRKHSTL